MSNRASEIVKHKLEDGFNFVFSITRVMGKGGILYQSATKLFKHNSGKYEPIHLVQV